MALFNHTVEENKHVHLATKTLAAIEEAIAKDQGAAYRVNLGNVIPHIGDAYSPDNTPFRSHMGASLIGGECKRAVWYGFRWFTKPKFEGRMIRLFNRGHLEEARFIAMLLTIGCPVYQQDANGKQFRISDCKGHFGGSSDGIIFNLPDFPNQYSLAEFKTHGEKSFIALEKSGVAIAKPEHLVQMNVYMEKMNIPICLYMAVNKNTDMLYAEFVFLDKQIAVSHIDLANDLIFSDQPPKKINNSVGYYKCRFCEHRAVCHSDRAPDYNCRTCSFSRPIDNGEWLCEYSGQILTKEDQLEGCDNYIKKVIKG